MKRLINLLQQLNIREPKKKAELLEQYMELVLERNQHVNLTAITEREAFIEKHYVDSLVAAGLPEFQEAKSVLDLGTGGGFPGVPLAVAFPEKRFTLADSLNKRIRIIQEFCGELGIDNVTAIHGRAEELGRDPALREKFDLCVSRAVADLRVLSEYCLPFVRPGGWCIAYKGADCAEEVAAAEHAIRLLGGEIARIAPAKTLVGASNTRTETPQRTASVEEGTLPGASDIGEHQLVLIHKTSHTPPSYPRKPGTPSKKPL